MQKGDEYPRSTPLRHLASELADRVSTLDTGLISNVARILGKGLYRTLRMGGHGIMAGAWHGNDTAWRMALDIARILRFARVEGSLADTPQRNHVVFVDGVMGGEAEGPVYPTGRPVGVVVFGSDPVWTDFAAARVMQFNPFAVRLIGAALEAMRYPATDARREEVRVVLDGEDVGMAELTRVLARPFTPPKGWRDCPGLITPLPEAPPDVFLRESP